LCEIIDKLDKLTRVVALSSTRGLTMTERISILAKCGFRPIEIAGIVGTTSNVVNVRLSQLRKKRW
jgi:hypothetical protein